MNISDTFYVHVLSKDEMHHSIKWPSMAISITSWLYPAVSKLAGLPDFTPTLAREAATKNCNPASDNAISTCFDVVGCQAPNGIQWSCHVWYAEMGEIISLHQAPNIKSLTHEATLEGIPFLNYIFQSDCQLKYTPKHYESPRPHLCLAATCRNHVESAVFCHHSHGLSDLWSRILRWWWSCSPSLQIWKLSTWKLLQESFSASFSFSANPTEKVFLPSKKCFYRRNLKTGWEISDNLRGHGGQLDADPYPLGPRIHWGAREGKSCGESFRMACLRNLDNHGFNCFGEMPKRCKTKSKM